jgi:hypothetical protein
MKVGITGASHFVNRMFEACGKYQWARELVKNSLEAGATKIVFGVEPQAVKNLGVYRRTVADNGCGMDRDELLRYFSALGAGAKAMGGLHDNFGLGAKIASLPWNPDGGVVISYKAGRGAMIRIRLEPTAGEYELVEFEVDGEKTCVVEPGVVDGVDWAAVRPDWLRDHGTVVVLLGSQQHPDTALGNPHAGETDTGGLSAYLNSRLWDLSAVDVEVVELRQDAPHRSVTRTVRGARFDVVKPGAPRRQRPAHGVVRLDKGRVVAEWYLRRGGRPAADPAAGQGGFIAVRYDGELFHLTSAKAHFRWFGVAEGQVQRDLTVILEPQKYLPGGGGWGVHPDQSRNRLLFTGDREKGAEVPLADWGPQFADNMPAAVLEAVRAARSDLGGSIEDDDYRKRLQDRFGDRWRMKVFVPAKEGDPAGQPGTVADETGTVIGTLATNRRGPNPTARAARQLASPGGSTRVVRRDAPADVPRYRLARAADFERPWHLAVWAPHDPEGPTVLLNADSFLLQEVVAHHQQKYPDVYAEEVARTVRQVFGEVAACKVAHAQKLARQVAREELDRDYRSERALTVALMGLMAEDSLIAQRLSSKLGRTKPAGQVERN